MHNDKSETTVESVASRARREFLRTSAKAAVAAPAATLLLSAHAKKASAQQIYDVNGEA